ncbi:RDD family protein [Geofilum rubicundum]|nr:RDD family protein [Geofilum rubicundum]
MSTTRLTESATAPFTERIIAAFIDIIIVIGLCFFPRVGWMIGIIYHLTRDSMPFLYGQSFGKHLMQIKVIALPQKTSLTRYPEKSIIRGLVMMIPILNIIDIWYFLTKGYRLADKWAETTVVRHVKDDDSEGMDGSST